MGKDSGQRGRTSQRRRRWLKRLIIGIPAVFVLYIGMSVAYVGLVVYNPRRVVRHLYDSWRNENREADDSFRKLALANGWKMYAINSGSIGCLDFGRSTYEPLYSPGKRRCILGASSPRDGRIAFIECRVKSSWLRATVERSDFRFGMLEGGRVSSKVRLEVFGGWPLPEAIDLWKDRAFFARGNGAYLHNIGAGTIEKVFELPPEKPYKDVIKGALVEGKFMALLVGQFRPEYLLVLEAKKPYCEISRVDGVSNIVTVGEHIVIEKGQGAVECVGFEYVVTWGDGDCFLYDPETRTTDHLTAGHLLCACGVDQFLFCILDVGTTSQGWGPVYRYRISTRSKEPVWQPVAGGTGFAMRSGDKKLYDYTKVILSPDGLFLFIPWHLPPRSHAELHLAQAMEYEVFDLKSAQKRGAFLDLFGAKFFVSFLGWYVDRPPDPDTGTRM